MKKTPLRQKTPLRAKKTLKRSQSRIASKKRATGQNLANKRPSKSQAHLKKKLDILFSQYIRHKFSKHGMCLCYTCDKILPIKQIQNGHFISRQYLATRWEVDNCRPQCFGCNVYGHGKFLDFEERLVKEVGKNKVEEMKRRRHQIIKLDTTWYEQQIAFYTEELKKFHGHSLS